MDTKVAKNERTGVRPEKFVCRVGCEPKGRSEPSLWVGSELKAELSHQDLEQEMDEEQGEKCVQKMKCEEQKDQVFICSACLVNVGGMAGGRVGKPAVRVPGLRLR